MPKSDSVMIDFAVSSNDGWNELRLTFGDRIASDNGILVVTRVLVKGLFLDRQSGEASGYTSPNASLVEDWSTSFYQVLLTVDQLREFLECMTDWLRDNCPQEVTLGVAGTSLSFRLGGRDRAGHAQLTTTLSTSRIRVEVGFESDESCIRCGAEELAKWLKPDK